MSGLGPGLFIAKSLGAGKATRGGNRGWQIDLEKRRQFNSWVEEGNVAQAASHLEEERDDDPPELIAWSRKWKRDMLFGTEPETVKAVETYVMANATTYPRTSEYFDKLRSAAVKVRDQVGSHTPEERIRVPVFQEKDAKVKEPLDLDHLHGYLLAHREEFPWAELVSLEPADIFDHVQRRFRDVGSRHGRGLEAR